MTPNSYAMPMRPLLRIASTATITGIAALAYATLVERNLFTLRRLTVPILPPQSAPLRILHISDLHITPKQHYKSQWIKNLGKTDPDLVIVTGDNIAAVDSVPTVIRALQPLLQRPGAFVFGSNDYRGPRIKNPFEYFKKNRQYQQGAVLPSEELRDALTGAGWLDLNNAYATMKIGDMLIDLIGVDDPHINKNKYPAVPEQSHDTNLRIGLLHSPEPHILDTMAADGCQLILAGHTHGGQVRVPLYGALVTNCGLHRKMARGLHPWPGSTTYLHVSAGLGTHPTAPIRFACPPEVSVLTLTPISAPEQR